MAGHGGQGEERKECRWMDVHLISFLVPDEMRGFLEDWQGEARQCRRR
jgi:hypothetical protein